METLRLLATVVLWTVFAGCSSDRRSSPAPDCGCEEPDGGECVDTDPPDPDGGVPGWRMTWAVQAGGDMDAMYFNYEVAWDLAPISDSALLVYGRYQYEGLFGAGEPNETILPHFGSSNTSEDTNCFVALYDRAGDLQWAQGYGGDSWDFGAFGETLDEEGALWALGGYDMEVTIGLGQPNETSLFADSFEWTGALYHLVLAKFSIDGQLSWAIRAIDVENYALFRWSAVLPDGSIAVAGHFKDAIALAPGTPEELILTSPGDRDGAIARFGTDGTLLWARQITGSWRELVWSVTRLLGGELMVAGTYQATAVLGEGEANETALTCGAGMPDGGSDDDGERCPFIAAYDEDGALLWAKDLGYTNPVQDVFPTVEAAPDGGFVVAGGFLGTAILGAGEPNETVISATQEDRFDLLVARYDSDGDLLWARQTTGGLDDPTSMDSYTGYPMAFLDSGELVVAGNYQDAAPVFGHGEPHETVLSHVTKDRVFIAMFYANGNLAWAIEQGGPAKDIAASVAAYSDSTFFVGGAISGESTFGTCSEDEKTMFANGNTEIFVLRFDRTTE